jgi:ferric-dicitrate binding protein FerR (iron transport regulator)
VTSPSQKSIHSDTLLDEASQWVVRLSSDQLTETVLQDFALWLAEHNDHKLAYDEIAELWLDLGSVEHLPLTINPSDASTTENVPPDVVPSEYTTVRTNTSITANSGFLFTRFVGRIGNSSKAVALAVSLVLVVMAAHTILDQSKPQQFATAVEELQALELLDGSTVTLDTSTRLDIILSDH